MANVTLTTGVRNSLLALQSTADMMTTTQQRLSTGKKVNSALDGPQAYFTASGLNNRAADLGSLLDSMSNGIQTIQAGNNGITSLTSLVSQLKSVVTQARADATAGTVAGVSVSTVRQGLMDQFNALRTQLDELAGDAGFNGINLLNGDDLTVNFNEDGTSSITVQSTTTFTATGLGVAAGTVAIFSDNTALDTMQTDLTDALTTLRTEAGGLSSSLSVMQTRQSFTKSMITTLNVGADNLTVADMNEESANMLALQTRNSLSTSALSLANQAAQSVLRLFG